MVRDLRKKTRTYMQERGITRDEMARRIDFPVSTFCKWLDHRHIGTRPREVEAALVAYFKRTELIERQDTVPVSHFLRFVMVYVVFHRTTLILLHSVF